MRPLRHCASGAGLTPAALTAAIGLAAGLAALLAITTGLTITAGLAAVTAWLTILSRAAIAAWLTTIAASLTVVARRSTIAARGLTIAAVVTAAFRTGLTARHLAKGAGLALFARQWVEHRAALRSGFAVASNPFVADILIARLAVAGLATVAAVVV